MRAIGVNRTAAISSDDPHWKMQLNCRGRWTALCISKRNSFLSGPTEFLSFAFHKHHCNVYCAQQTFRFL